MISVPVLSFSSLLSADLLATRAQARSQGSDLPRVGGSPSAASSDGGAVPGSAAASAAPPTFCRQSPRALACVLRARPCVRTSLSPPASAVPVGARPAAQGGRVLAPPVRDDESPKP